MAVDPALLEILVCPACKTPVQLVKDGAASVRRLPPRLSHQGRHPGDAHRRGDDRSLTRVDDPARPPAPDRRRDVHHARDSARCGAASPTRTSIYLVEAPAAPVVAGQPASLRGHRHPRIGAAGARLRDDVAPGARSCAARAFDVAIDLHGGPRSAWLTWATRAPRASGLRCVGPRVDVHARRAAAARAARRGTRCENQWDLLGAVDPAFADAAGSGARSRRDAGGSGGARAPVRRAAGGARRRRPTTRSSCCTSSAGNPFRRWPEASFAELARGLVDARAATLGDRHRRAVGCATAADAWSRRRGSARATRPRASSPRRDWSLAELRALMDRAALFVGGDSGPLHIAATTDVPIVGAVRPDAAGALGAVAAGAPADGRRRAGPLPCRPCDQRVCAPGDFRCLTRHRAPTRCVAAARAAAGDGASMTHAHARRSSGVGFVADRRCASGVVQFSICSPRRACSSRPPRSSGSSWSSCATGARPATPAFFLPLLVYAALTLRQRGVLVDPRASFVDSQAAAPVPDGADRRALRARRRARRRRST